MTLGLREANQQFSRVIRAVRGGREVVLTERGRPIAVIKPIARDAETEERARLEALAAEGLLVLAEKPGPMPKPRWRPAPWNGVSIAESIDRDRDETL